MIFIQPVCIQPLVSLLDTKLQVLPCRQSKFPAQMVPNDLAKELRDTRESIKTKQKQTNQNTTQDLPGHSHFLPYICDNLACRIRDNTEHMFSSHCRAYEVKLENTIPTSLQQLWDATKTSCGKRASTKA